MCGIVGLLDPTDQPIDLAVLGAMTHAVARRGPDGHGIFTAPGIGLGHRRLAVIDLTEAADQPLANETGYVRVVFNGEIYNFAQLRQTLLARGHQFRSQGDTEVIVHGYEEWGDGVVERLDGMFAFALWDGKQRRLLAARDRMGKKPLYFAQISRPGKPPLFAFASELKALAPIPELDRRIDPAALASYLAFEYVPPPRSIISGACKLDAAERLTLEYGKDPFARPTVDRYWTMTFPQERARVDEREATETLRTLLRQAVARRLVADVPLGVFLSGGVDSSTVAALMADIHGSERIKTFAIGFSDPTFDESAHARDVARFLGTDHHEERLDSQAMLRILPDVAAFMDEPLADASIVPTYLLSRFARQHVTVALGGDGGDELFAGYPTFRADLAGRLYFDHLPRPLRNVVSRMATHLPARTGYFSFDFKVNQFLRGGDSAGPRRHQRWMASFLPEELQGLLAPDISRRLASDPLDQVDQQLRTSTAQDGQDRLLEFYARFFLAGDVNTKVDRASGAVGLEVRAPLLDTDVVNFACRLPPGLRLRGLTSKYILKRAMQGRLPDSVLQRRKQGFGVPVARWMRN